MAFDYNLIDADLRLVGRIFKIIFPANRSVFKFYHRLHNVGGPKTPKSVRLESAYIARSNGGGDITVRIYSPKRRKKSEPPPVVLYFHGGGYIMGAVSSALTTIERIIEISECIVVAPEYRKAFDAPYPSGVNDCYDTLLWLRDHVDDLGVDPKKIIVAGHSGGGGLACAVTLRARDRGEVDILFQMPIYPMIDDRSITPSSRNNEAPGWNTKSNKLAWEIYLRDLLCQDADIPYDAAPARAADLSGLPPTVSFVSDLDPFLDENVEYVSKLRDAGVPVKFKVFENAFHGFDQIAPNARVSQQAWAFFEQAFLEGLDGDFSSWMGQDAQVY